MFVMKRFALIWGFFLLSSFCGTLGQGGTTRFKNMLFITAVDISNTNATFPSNTVYKNTSDIKVCFNIPANTKNAGCCAGFDCSAEIHKVNDTIYNVTLDQTTLSSQDVVVLMNPIYNFSCLPKEFYNSSGLLLNLDNCLKPGGKNIRLSQGGLCGQSELSSSSTCAGSSGTMQTKLQFEINPGAKTCNNIPCEIPTTTVKPTTATQPNRSTTTTQPPMIEIPFNQSGSRVTPDEAVKIMDNLYSILDQMGNSSTATIKLGNITGTISKLPTQNQTTLSFRFVTINDTNTHGETDFYRTIHIPKEASEMALEQNSSYVGVMLFPGMSQSDNNSFFFNDEILGIEMGAKISGLSQTIDIYYSSVKLSGLIASCMSWDGEVNSNWTTDGCQTVDANGSITCRCNHLTFFAILMSPAPTNISASDYKTLAQITEAGCGVSMFFLGVALFMHFLLRKTKATNATKILINLFVAMFFLNFGFLINRTIADLQNAAGCVAIAAFLHYNMLATFTWFSMQALHLYFSLRKFPADIKHYMCKLYTTGWVIPAVVIVPLLALKKYGNIVIHVDDGSSANMCWIPDSSVHVGVNIGYYAVVFLFTFSIFGITVMQILHFKSKAVKVQDSSSTKKKFFSILGLFCLLGISWGFAFFSFGPLLIPSFYIFTILNSFQGFLLFIYYYYSTKITPDAKDSTTPTSSSSTPKAVENIYTANPHG